MNSPHADGYKTKSTPSFGSFLWLRSGRQDQPTALQGERDWHCNDMFSSDAGICQICGNVSPRFMNWLRTVISMTTILRTLCPQSPPSRRYEFGFLQGDEGRGRSRKTEGERAIELTIVIPAKAGSRSSNAYAGFRSRGNDEQREETMKISTERPRLCRRGEWDRQCAVPGVCGARGQVVLADVSKCTRSCTRRRRAARWRPSPCQ